MKKENPLPEEKSDNELAKEFVEFFLNKTEAIQNDLKYDHLQDLSQDKVRKIITTMVTKLCKMDMMPTKILKQTLSLLEIIMEIINRSLRQGVFVSSWKCARVFPLH